LARSAAGSKVRILGINGGKEMQSRLLSLGLLPGIEVEVQSTAAHDPVLLLVQQARLAIGHTMAAMIVVG